MHAHIRLSYISMPLTYILTNDMLVDNSVTCIDPVVLTNIFVRFYQYIRDLTI